ncbi:hypothetical protein PTSG_10487 [Salpingoeca rosetta]|uniref:RanBD1 domain-containing protein n=1 Tax=Salpingoeca rosetta (strain ATCC 50818 / BSB-021) TaxID=946362 RepID=F2UPT4_SALR5|nr:uncharacterized protein PTSG_10487 [Salpingoeca rosetta]EGD79639.1 hypothetical protein PTSG_10487 [Salpingoeca rosetta]|eukprot:XP_004988867.1 hypothetical protein PTSG_10487 [Salpingoeca rosetta]
MSAKRRPDKQITADDPDDDGDANEGGSGPFLRASKDVVSQRRIAQARRSSSSSTGSSSASKGAFAGFKGFGSAAVKGVSQFKGLSASPGSFGAAPSSSASSSSTGTPKTTPAFGGAASSTSTSSSSSATSPFKFGGPAKPVTAAAAAAAAASSSGDDKDKGKEKDTAASSGPTFKFGAKTGAITSSGSGSGGFSFGGAKAKPASAKSAFGQAAKVFGGGSKKTGGDDDDDNKKEDEEEDEEEGSNAGDGDEDDEETGSDEDEDNTDTDTDEDDDGDNKRKKNKSGDDESPAPKFTFGKPTGKLPGLSSIFGGSGGGSKLKPAQGAVFGKVGTFKPTTTTPPAPAATSAKATDGDGGSDLTDEQKTKMQGLNDSLLSFLKEQTAASAGVLDFTPTLLSYVDQAKTILTAGKATMVTAPSSSGAQKQQQQQSQQQPEEKEELEEGVLYKTRVKLRYQQKGEDGKIEWKEKGTGTLRLEDAEDGTKKRVIIRADGTTGLILLNVYLASQTPVNRTGKREVMTSMVPNPPLNPKKPEDKPVVFMISCKTPAFADELAAKMKEAKEAC